jgi:hypothetical protein
MTKTSLFLLMEFSQEDFALNFEFRTFEFD